MSSASGFSTLQKLALLLLLLAIGIPLYYDSTNPKYLQFRLVHSLLTIKHRLVSDSDRPMLSAEYRAFESLLQSVPLVEFDRAADPFETVQRMRSTSFFDLIVPRPSKCRSQKQIFEYEGSLVEAYWVDYRAGDSSQNWNEDRILLYFHGGGYLLGDFKVYSGFECHLSRLFNITVIHLEYRRPPEHPLPAAVADAVRLYRALLRHGISPSRLATMGDCAGGGLALLAIQAILARQLPKPRAVITLSPWADLSLSGKSHTRNRLTDVMNRNESMDWVVEQVLGGDQARKNPVYSPLFGSFKDFPPLYITVGTTEVLEDDSQRVARRARKEGVDVTFEIGKDMMHVHPMFFAYFPEASDTLNNIARWLATRLG